MQPSEFCVRLKLKTFYILVHAIDKKIRVRNTKNEFGGAYGQYGREKRGKQGFWWKTTGKEITWKA